MQQVVKYRRASTQRRAAWWWWAWGHTSYAARVMEARLSILKFATTVAAFVAFVCALPALIFIYTGIKCWRVAIRLWAVRAVEGVEEVTGVTVRSAMEAPANPGLDTLLLCLAGSPSIHHLRDRILEEIIDRVDKKGKLLHPNFRRRLVQVGGCYAWRKHQDFDIGQHVVMAPVHHKGRLLTSRNIQEYVSEVISQPLPEDLPPWHVSVVTTCDGGDGDGETWIVGRAHHLLAAHLSLPDELVTAYPDPWRQPATRRLTLLAAPAATKRFIKMVITIVMTFIISVSRACSTWWKKQRTKVVAPAVSLLEETLQSLQKVIPEEELPAPLSRITAAVVVVICKLWTKTNEKFSLLKSALFSYMHAECFYHICLYTVSVGIILWWRIVVGMVKLPCATWSACRDVYQWVKRVHASREYKIVVDAFVEVYWMTRAFVTLPRLVLEEALSIKGVTPLMGWVGRRRRTLSSRGLGRPGNLAVAWSDPVPLSTARGVRGATGATLSEVLLTASSGAIRDYLRITGLPVPDEVCSTIPVYSQMWADSRGIARTPGLVTLALPTGATGASSALEALRRSMGKIRDYPERYLASVWLLRNVAYFLPESLLGSVFRALSNRYPILMSNLAGPSQTLSVWGHDLLNVYYWRPPQDGAVLSVCVASYKGFANIGIVADGRVVPNVATIPQAFVTHLNELAVDAGVRLERHYSRTWSRGNSPGSTPAGTPPSTPTLTPTLSHKMSFPHRSFQHKMKNKLTRRQSSIF